VQRPALDQLALDLDFGDDGRFTVTLVPVVGEKWPADDPAEERRVRPIAVLDSHELVAKNAGPAGPDRPHHNPLVDGGVTVPINMAEYGETGDCRGRLSRDAHSSLCCEHSGWSP